MADPVNVAFNVTEKGFDKILRDVGLLRSELEALGVDVSGPVQRALNGIESTSVKISRSTRDASAAYKTAARDARDLAAATKAAAEAEQNLSNAQQRRRTQISSERTTRTNQGQGGADYRNASTSIDAIIQARRQQAAAFGDQIERRLQGEAREAEKTARAVDRLAQASSRRAKVEEDYYRNRYRQNNRNAMADFDAEFKQLEELQRLNEQASSPATRYALYDVAAAYTAVGASLAGVAIYAGVVGADFQSAFVNVARTTDPLVATDEYLQNLRSSLVQLSGQIPLTFRELTEIATLGNQLGIAEDSIAGFTDTVARFSSVAGISIEEVARAFGGIRAQTGLSEQYFENLASAMSLVSVRSNATEAQIISLTREIASTTSGAGFAIDEIVGLAGALASLQVAPERARGVLDTYFNRLNTAVREGGDSLDAFARLTGKTAEEVSNLVRAGEGAEIFQSLIAGLRNTSSDVVELDANLEAVGLTGLRASNTFQRFINSLGVSEKAFADANEGFISGAENIRQYEMTAATLAAQFQILLSGINAIVDAVSGGAVESLGDLLRVVNNVIFAFADWLGNNRVVAQVIAFAVAVAGITGALFLVRSGMLLARAATIAMANANITAATSSNVATASFGRLIGALFGVTTGMTRAAAAAAIFRRTLPGLIATGAAFGLSFLAEKFLGVEDKAGDAALSNQEYLDVVASMKKLTSDGAGATDGLADSLGGAGKAAEEAAIKVRTLVDYVGDLNGVFQRSSDIRFGSQAALDEITLKWIELNEQVEEYQRQVRSLTQERGLKEYFLGIAEAYDDQLRAAQLREEIAKIDDDLAKAQAGASTELSGNSKAAIENRKVFRDLLGSYEDYISALTSAGASQEQIQAVVSQLNSDFGAQATALGFNSNEVQNYQQRFQDLATILATVPASITVGFDPNPAQLALNEFFAKAAEQARQAGQSAGDAFGDGLGGGVGGIDLGSGLRRPLDGASRTTRTWWDSLWNTLFTTDWNAILVAATVEVTASIVTFFTRTLPAWFEGGVSWAGEVWTGFTTWLQQSFSGFATFFEGFFGTPVTTVAMSSGQRVGDSFASGVSSGTSNTLNRDQSVRNWVNTQNNSAYSNGSTIGRNIGGGITAGLNAALTGRILGPTLEKRYTGGLVGSGKPFAGGGYTGAGHWLEPAGVVHRGEYVIPKKHVNQSTGLPDASYVASLQRGRSAPTRGYAGGGFVGGGFGDNGPIELGPVSLGAIMNGLSVRLNVGREQLARATSGGNSRLAFTGSN